MARALIIGGGIGGLSAAVALRAAGIDVAVFERAPELREVGAGITLWTNAVRCLRKLGVAAAVESCATEFTLSELRSWNSKPIIASDLSVLTRRLGAPTLGVHRADLQRALADALPPGTIHLGAECTGFEADTGGVTALFAGGRRERGDLLVGADGIHSRVRAQIHGGQKPRYAGYTAWRGVGLIDHPAVPTHLTLLAMGRGSQFGIVPIGRGRTYWFATMNAPEGGKDPEGGARRFLLDRYKDWYAPVPAVIGATDEAGIIRNDIIDRPPIRDWGAGHVTLLGDAAHPTTPNLGQGACQAIEDAVVLARHLGAGNDVEPALRLYETDRYERTALITNQSWKLGKILAWESGFWCGVRDRLFRLFSGSVLKQTEKLVGVEV